MSSVRAVGVGCARPRRVAPFVRAAHPGPDERCELGPHQGVAGLDTFRRVESIREAFRGRLGIGEDGAGAESLEIDEQFAAAGTVPTHGAVAGAGEFEHDRSRRVEVGGRADSTFANCDSEPTVQPAKRGRPSLPITT